uniref:RRM domain-containing protein n=1 Tax=Anolis carolinensis TaxID=28377 RepID=A0A803SYS4_ANOCA
MCTFLSTGHFLLWVELRMAVVIRLQGLPVVAGPADIRHLFSGLNIPDGGVYITGGEKGEAFVIFETDEDARQAMSYSERYIKNSRIGCFLSSKTEMQNVIELNRKRFDHSGRETIGSRWIDSSNSSSFSNIVASMSKGTGRSGYDSVDPFEDRLHSNGSENSSTDLSKLSYNHPRSNLNKITHNQFKTSNSDELYLFIRSMPYTATEDDIIAFFDGLQVDGMIMLKTNGVNNGDGLVKFATPTDCTRGLQRDRQYMRHRFIRIYRSNEETWIKSMGKKGLQMHQDFSDEQFSHDFNKERRPDFQSSRMHTRSKSPPRRVVAHTHSRSPPKRIAARTVSRSPPRSVMTHSHSRSISRRAMAHTHSRSPPRRITARSRSPLSGSSRSPPHNGEHYIHVKKLPFPIEKRELRAFFEDLDIPDSHITFLKIPDNRPNKDAVVMFRSMRDYYSALGYHKYPLRGQEILLFPIPKEAVMQLAGFSENEKSPERYHIANEKGDWDRYSDPKTCVYVRNFPYDVTKREIHTFFAGFNINNYDIHLLYDDKGIGLGETLVKFRTEDDARKAENLNRRRFLGTEVLLRCISEKQMKEFGVNVPPVSDGKMQDHIRSYERGQQGNQKHPSDYRHPPSDLISTSDNFKDSAPFTEFGEDVRGNFPGGRFMSDSNVSGSSNCFTLIKLKNIPFRATPNEILDFFHGYKIIPESLSIQHNQYGLPSGEAVIALVNYNEAMAVVNELNDRPIGQRKIRLTLV